MKIFESSILALLENRCDYASIFYDQANKILTCNRIFYFIRCIFEKILLQLDEQNQNNDDLEKIKDTYFNVNSKTYEKMLQYFRIEVYEKLNFYGYHECSNEQINMLIKGFTKSFAKHILSLADRKIFYESAVRINLLLICIKFSKDKAKLMSNKEHLNFSVYNIPYEVEKNQNKGTKIQLSKNNYVCISKFCE